jgi:hypothetical protein
MYVDHIEEHTNAHGIVLDDGMYVDHIGEATLAHTTTFDDDVTVAGGTMYVDHIAENTSSHGIVFDDMIVSDYHKVGCNAYLGTGQSNIPNNDLTNVLLDTETYDLGSCFSTGSNQFSPPVDGYYFLYGQITWSGITATQEYETFLRKNGTTTLAYGKQHSSTTDSLVVNTSTIQPLITTDTVKLVARHQAGVNTPDIATVYTYMVIHLLYRT